MNQLITSRRLIFILIILAIVFLIPTIIAAQNPHPRIPHPLQGFEDCLKCHETGKAGAKQIPDNHVGIKGDVCTVCHQSDVQGEPFPGEQLKVPHATEGYENCLDCHSEGSSAPPASIPVTIPTPTGNPMIPHTLIDRESCLDCHREGKEMAPQIPEDHQDMTNDMCRGCHQPAAWFVQPTPTPVPLGPVPTPIAHLQSPGGGNSCLDCHTKQEDEKLLTVVDNWQRSIHAERDVTCVDCHGGDPSATTKEAAKAPGAGYVGVPDKATIPELCASCHADVTQMRQYDLPTDQYAKYRQSIHGIRLHEGDTNVATCADCHNGHLILKANDPASSVYPATVPATCAKCHADEELMAPYEIPTNQFDLYKQSVHGHAMLDEQNFRAPNCATCHGTHGAAPPGFEEVANVCGSCHSAAQDAYLTSAHASGSDNAPKCITCHGRYDVSKPSEDMYLGSEPRHCGSCHPADSESGKVASGLYNTLDAAATSFQDAEDSIDAVREVRMLTAPLEGKLHEANTALITARNIQHSLDLDAVTERTEKTQEVAAEIQTDAETDLSKNLFRRQAMIIAVVIIIITIVALYLLKKELDRRLDAS